MEAYFLEANKKSIHPLPSFTPGDADIQDFYAKLLTGNGGANCWELGCVFFLGGAGYFV